MIAIDGVWGGGGGEVRRNITSRGLGKVCFLITFTNGRNTVIVAKRFIFESKNLTPHPTVSKRCSKTAGKEDIITGTRPRVLQLRSHYLSLEQLAEELPVTIRFRCRKCLQ